MDTDHINRRGIVRLGVSVGAIIVAGCLGGQGDVNKSDEIATNTNNSNNSINDAGNNSPIKQTSIVDADTIDSQETSGIYHILIENAGTETREFSIQAQLNGEIIFDDTDELPADKAYVLTMDNTGTYTTTVESQSDRSTTTTVSDNDCSSRTIISFSNDGVVSRNENHC